MENNAGIGEVLKVMLLYAPKTIWYAGPIAFLFTVTYVLSDLYSKNEMEALFASGISLVKFVAPIFVLAVFCSVFMFFWEDKLVVPTLEKKQTLQNELLNVEVSANNSNVIVQSMNGKVIYKTRLYLDDEKRINHCYFIFRDDEKKLEAVIYANSAVWDTELSRWILEGGLQYSYQNGTMEIVPLDMKYLELLTEPNEIFKNSNVNVESVNVKDARFYIDHLKKAGLPYYEELSVYYKKFAFPLIFLIAGMLAVGVTGRTRKNVLLISLVLSVVSVVLFYVFQMCTMVMAKTQFLTPLMGAWFPDIIFFSISVALLKYSRT